MNTKSKISTWQLLSVLLVLRLLSTITFMPILDVAVGNSDYIIAMAIGGFSTFIFFIPTFLLLKNGKGLFEISDKVSKKLTKIIAILYALFFLIFIFSALVRMNLFVSAIVFPQKSTALFMVISIAATCYAASHGLEALGRTGTISLFMFISSFIVILLSLIERVDINHLSPVFFYGISPVSIVIWSVIIRTVEPAVLLVLLPKVSGKTLKSFALWIVSFTVITTLIFFFLMTTLGDASLLQLFPIHSMAVLSRFSVFERMDALLMGMWIFSAFVKVSFLMFLVADIISSNFKKVSLNGAIVFLGIINSLAVLIASNSLSSFKVTTSLTVRSSIFLAFVVIIPMILFLIDKFYSGAKE